MTPSPLRNLFRPGRIARSAWYSFRHQRDGFWRLPIVAASSARVERHRDARLRVRGRLVLGYDAYPPRHGISRRSNHGALLWLLDAESSIETYGRVVLAQGVQIAVGRSGRVTIGDESYVNQDTRILCLDRIAIGRGCAISWEVQIMDFDGHEISAGAERRQSTAPVLIGDRVLIGARAMVLKGVELGDGAVVAAGAVVTRSVSPGTLVAGNPARVVRTGVTWS